MFAQLLRKCVNCQ